MPRAASLYLSGGGAAAASGTAAASGGAAAGSGGRKKKKKTKGGKQQAEEEDAEEEEEEGGFTLVSGSPAGAADIAALPLATQKTLHALVVRGGLCAWLFACDDLVIFVGMGCDFMCYVLCVVTLCEWVWLRRVTSMITHGLTHTHTHTHTHTLPRHARPPLRS